MKQQQQIEHGGWKQHVRQTDRRTAADRREYMQRYHAQRRQDNGMDGNLPHVSIPETPRCPPADSVFVLRDEMVRHHLRDGSGRMMWPERRHEFPESLEETLRRV
jgi:hypothetical protein